MTAKRFFIAALSCALLLLAGTAAVVAWADPLLTAGALEEGEPALFVNERYEMAGLIRYQDYEDLVMGTSLVANYRASWFTRETGRETLKVTFPDGRLSEFDIALDLAFRTHRLNTVYFGLDPNVLIREDQSVELPEYLYNDNPLDDLEFYFNGESLALAVKSLALGDGAEVPLDEAFIWDGKHQFSWLTALESYPRPEAVSEEQLPAEAYLAAAEVNMDTVCSWLEEHPDTQFKIWFPPYSILYWDKAHREGNTEAILTAIEYACGRLLAYDNVTVHSFLNDRWTTTDLEQYTDHVHCSSLVTSEVAKGVINGDWRMWPEYYHGQVDELRQFVNNYDYESLYSWLFEDLEPQ